MKKQAIILLFLMTLVAGKVAGQCTVNLTSTAGTDNQTVCESSPITDITYYSADATGATFTGLPDGVTGSWIGPEVTIIISGTPLESGIFNYQVNLTGGGDCTATGTITVNPVLTASVSIVADANTVCAGTTVNFTATPVNGDTPIYQWYVEGAPVGTDNAVYSYVPSNGDQVEVVMTSSETCISGSPATSNTVTMAVNSALPVSVSIAADANPACAGSTVNFTATPVNGGTPIYQWYVEGAPVGTDNAVYSYTPSNGDQVEVVMTSSETCTSGSPATSNTVIMAVNPVLPVSVSIVADANTVCAGTAVNFTATPVNGGTPIYQWYVEGAPVGTDNAVYSYAPSDGDQVEVVMTSSETCVSGSPATSNTATMTVNPLLGIPTFTAGATSLCKNPSNTTYTAEAANSLEIAYSYSSSPPGAGSINASSGSMNWENGWSGIAIITATATGLCPQTTADRIVTVYEDNPDQPGTITGFSSVCRGQAGVGYSINTVVDAISYIWTVPTGAYITSGQGTTSITVDYASDASDLKISVKAENTCGLSSKRELSVTVNPIPTATISGTTTVCENDPSPPLITFHNPQSSAVTVTYNIDGTGPFTIDVTGSTATIPASVLTSGTFNYNLVSVAYMSGATCSNNITGIATVTVFPTVGTPTAILLTSGVEPVCQLTGGPAITIYSSTATDSTGLNWSVSNPIAGSISTSGVMTWATGFSGDVNIEVTASGCSAGIIGLSDQVTKTISITPTVGIPDSINVIGGFEPTCQLTNGTTTTNYQTSATNSTGYNWSLSNNAAGSIDASGVMTWANGFSGNVDIQVTANGCNGPSSFVKRTVSVTPTVGTPTSITISAGADPTCQLTNGTTTTTYATTAANSTGLTWSLSNPAAGSIDASGVMTWALGFSGSVDIEVSAIGCNSPSSTVKRQVYVTPAVGIPDSITIAGGVDPPCKLTSGTTLTFYTTSATNSTGFNWSVSDGAAGTINPTSGLMTWANGFSGSVDIQVTASGCGTSTPVIRTVIINPLPTVTISGLSNPRISSTGNIYTTEAGMSGYSWSVSGGGTGADASETFTVDWNTVGNQSVSVNYIDVHGCTALSPAVFPVSVKPLPIASGAVISGYPAIGETLTGSYSYDDGNGGTDLSTFRWLTDGTGSIPLATSDTYVPTASDLNKTLTFEVTPVSSVGPPYSGSVITSSATFPVEDLTGMPVADEVCIAGIRTLGNILRGDYRYTFSKAEGISIYKWFRKDTLSGISVLIGTNRNHTLVEDDLDDSQDIIFEVTPVSSNRTPITGIPAISKPLAKILIPKTEYSVAEADVVLKTNQPGGVFSGSGVNGNIFSPKSAGSAGSPYTLTYLLNIFNSSVTCSQQSSKIVFVNPNVAFFNGFDPIYCHDGGQDIITVTGVPSGADSLKFTLTNPDGLISQSGAAATIDPGEMRPGANVDVLSFSYWYLGTFYKISQAFDIDSVGSEMRLNNLEEDYCVSEGRQYVTVEGVYPAGGTAVWTGDILSDPKPASVYVIPSDGTADTTYRITYQYKSIKGCYSAILTSDVTVKSLPDPSFPLAATYNMYGGKVTLEPVQSGGVFSGPGIISGTIFDPEEADLGDKNITYRITDNGCTDSLTRVTNVRKARGYFTGILPVICYSDTTYNVKTVDLPVGVEVIDFENFRNSIDWEYGDNFAYYNVRAAGAGKDTLTLTYKWDEVDYSIYAYVNIDSLGKAIIDELEDDQVFCNDTLSFKLHGSPARGIFSGSVNGNNFDPRADTVRNTYVAYTYTNDETGCSTSITVPIVIHPAPQLSFLPVDYCIEERGYTTNFENYSTSTDSIVNWHWVFTDGNIIGDEYEKNPGFEYYTPGLHKVSLTAETYKGCITTADSVFDIGWKPKADFYWIKDCYNPDDPANINIELKDASNAPSTITSRKWSVGGTVFGTDQSASYQKPDTGYLTISYYVNTNYPNCFDTVTKNVYIRPTISLANDTYFEDFEAGRGGWAKYDQNSQIWDFGTPDRSVINDAASGVNAWYTSLITTNQKDSASIISPCFDFTGTDRPMINMDLRSRFNKDRDGAVLQYKIGDEEKWQALGTLDDGINWFNSPIIRFPEGIQLGWTTNSQGDTLWKPVAHTLNDLSGENYVKFRFKYGTDASSYDYDGMAFDNVWIGERTRKVLLEHFTNTNDPASKSANSIINTISNNKAEDVINIQYHTNFPINDDPFYTDNPEDASARILFYGLTRAPYVFIDGGTRQKFDMLSDFNLIKLDSNDITRRTLISTHFDISVSTTITDGILSVKGEVSAREDFESYSLTLFLAVTEKKHTGYTSTLGESQFLNVFRKFLPDAGGIDLKGSWTIGDVYTIPENYWTIEKTVNNSDIEVIAFIQNNVTKELYQAASEIKKDITVGIHDLLSAEGTNFALYPNPAVNEFTVAFREPLIMETEIDIYDIWGKTVAVYKAETGMTEFRVEDSTLKSGIYLVRISSKGRDLGYKKLIISWD